MSVEQLGVREVDTKDVLEVDAERKKRILSYRIYRVKKAIKNVLRSPSLEDLEILILGNRVAAASYATIVSLAVAYGVLDEIPKQVLLIMAGLFLLSASGIMAVQLGEETLSVYHKTKSRLEKGERVVPEDFIITQYCAVQGIYLAHKKKGLVKEFRENFPKELFPYIW